MIHSIKPFQIWAAVHDSKNSLSARHNLALLLEIDVAPPLEKIRRNINFAFWKAIAVGHLEC